ncbi:hypothetical protein G7046_g6367 [Stylonectria norvegica]|nr:hypothetical protein G7046_g6367 [Stylonectria norvegica]
MAKQDETSSSRYYQAPYQAQDSSQRIDERQEPQFSSMVQRGAPPSYTFGGAVPIPNGTMSIPAPIIDIDPRPARLRQLIAIPATSAKLGSPFLRAYPPVLAEFDISSDTFLEFVDHLNRVAVASPPLQVLGLAGNIVGMVPLMAAQVVGTAVDVVSTIATVAISKTQVAAVLKQANASLFGPRGLNAQIAKIDAVAKLAGIPIIDASGNIDERSPILAPLEDEDQVHSLSSQQRRLASLQPWISPLSIDALPEVNKPDDRWGRMHAAASERQRKRQETKMTKGREKMHGKWIEGSKEAREEYEEEMAELALKESKARNKSDHKVDKGLRKAEKKREKAEKEYEKEMAKVEKRHLKRDKEEKLMKKVLFLIITKTEGC